MIDLHDGPTLLFFLIAAIAAVSGLFFFIREAVAAGRKLDRQREALEKEIERSQRRGGMR